MCIRDRFVAVLDTGAGSSFIRQDELPQHMQKNIEPLQQQVDIRNATGKPVPIAGAIRLSVQIGCKTEEVQFFVAKELATAIVLGCDYCDQHVECIKPRRRIIEMDDGSTTPIVRRASRSQVEALLPEEQVEEERRKKDFAKNKDNGGYPTTARKSDFRDGNNSARRDDNSGTSTMVV